MTRKETPRRGYAGLTQGNIPNLCHDRKGEGDLKMILRYLQRKGSVDGHSHIHILRDAHSKLLSSLFKSGLSGQDQKAHDIN